MAASKRPSSSTTSGSVGFGGVGSSAPAKYARRAAATEPRAERRVRHPTQLPLRGTGLWLDAERCVAAILTRAKLGDLKRNSAHHLIETVCAVVVIVAHPVLHLRVARDLRLRPARTARRARKHLLQPLLGGGRRRVHGRRRPRSLAAGSSRRAGRRGVVLCGDLVCGGGGGGARLVGCLGLGFCLAPAVVVAAAARGHKQAACAAVAAQRAARLRCTGILACAAGGPRR